MVFTPWVSPRLLVSTVFPLPPEGTKIYQVWPAKKSMSGGIVMAAAAGRWWSADSQDGIARCDQYMWVCPFGK